MGENVAIARFLEQKASIMDGYIRPILLSEKERYEQLLSTCPIWKKEEFFAVTVFGDLLAYDSEGYIVLLNMVDGIRTVICAEEELFFSLVNDPEYQKDYFDIATYEYAKTNIGNLQSNECYIYEPVPALGGSKDWSTLSIGKTQEYLSILVAFL